MWFRNQTQPTSDVICSILGPVTMKGRIMNRRLRLSIIALLLPAVPKSLPNTFFKQLRADQGVLVSGAFRDGRLETLTAKAPNPMRWRYRIPAGIVEENRITGKIVKYENDLLFVYMNEIGTKNTELIQPSAVISA